jgi:hypothetical protein
MNWARKLPVTNRKLYGGASVSISECLKIDMGDRFSIRLLILKQKRLFHKNYTSGIIDINR